MHHRPTHQGTRVASVSRAMRVLETFAGHPEGIAVANASATLGYGKASLSKILATLEREGFIQQDAVTARFHLSWRLLALAFRHAEGVGVPALCLPIMQALADDTDELVQLGVVEQEQLLFVAKAEGPGRRIRMLPLLGAVAPLHATASGKVWLASLPEARAAAIVARQGLRPLTSHTLTTWAKLRPELRRVRRQGYGIVDEELVDGGRALAAPIVSDSRVVGAVAVSGPIFRITVAGLHRLAPRVREAAARLGAIWPHRVGARDFGLDVVATNGDGRRARNSR